MATTSQRTVTVQFAGDQSGSETVQAAPNTASPGGIVPQALASGNNTITPPAGATACTIQKPFGNTVALTLKGVNGDTGIALHLTDPDTISLAGAISFVINAASGVTVHLIWS